MFVLVFEGKSQVTFNTSNLPIVFIATEGQTIIPDTNIVADMGIIYNGPGEINHIENAFNNYDGRIAIRLRGNTSLAFPKKSFTIETQDSLGQNLNVSLIDLPEENDWVLYAPFSDKSLMRNVLIYELSRKMGMYAPRTKFCELFLNDEYQGVYVLIEKIKRDDNRVDIAKLTTNDTIGNELTGGYIILLDRYDGDGWHSIINWDIFFEYYEPDDDEILEVQKEYIQNFIKSLEYTIDTLTQLNDTTLTSTIDFRSFYDYIILNELSKNVDAYKLSTYMFKDKNSKNGTLKMGPIWDYNIAFGNNYDFSAYTVSDFIYSDSAFYDYTLFWFRKFMSFPMFQENIQGRWKQLRSTTLHIDSIYYIIDSCYNLLGQAQERNFTKWDILGKYVWPNYYYGDTYEEEIEILKVWLNARLIWMDENFATNLPGNLPKNYKIQIYPNPFINQITINTHNQEIHSMTFILFDSFGREVYRKIVKDYYFLQRKLNFNFEGLNLSGGFYFYNIIWNQDNIIKGKLIKLD
ncbi:MAG: CotH kinase family protein [Bacteroidales bacterium]|nr:CotH kinase family protein [Bacteroidales bacterium]